MRDSLSVLSTICHRQLLTSPIDDPTKSSTYKLVDAGAFSITYGDSSGAGGDYISDNVAIGGATIKPLEMGLAKSANLTQGLLGIGYTFNEASNTGASDSFEYPNIIDSMVSQGFIDVNAYSLYLDDLDASTGSIIFGGLDTDKFHGNLVQMPVVPHQFDNGTSYYSDFGVALTSFKIAGKDLTPTGSPIGPILDSGTSLTYLPTTIAQGIITQLGAFDDSQNPEGSGFILVNCNLQSSTSTFDFGFGGTDGSDSVTISIPYNEMVITPSKLGADLNGYEPKGITFTDICILDVLPSDSAPYILGDTFLRSAYVVYDLKNNIIGLAQTNFDSTSSNVVDFTASMTAIPAASGVASGAGISQTATGVVGGKTTAAGTTSATGTTTSKSAGVASVPALDFTALFVVGGSAMLAVLGGSLLLA